ncbi:helix-turn-helix domain-containing protein [Microbispora cellulosiformans]|uniref:Helix-turn-helix domain-containing protein n=1 Tax=Microbispora cellulosiformans TaxID=2614688 RepID=A0A5J5K845_9ACTN|nr:helix-turn-helix transcriptional regulator [Microbispora cellulosiformans]KAA9380831.1 helix-turn-helix domain-containing protein [Microbispora cellulosiformans]
MLAALKSRDIGAVFRFVRQYGGLSQTAIGSLTGYSQGKISAIMSGSQQVTALEVFERIADGLHRPDQARMALGLAPRDPAAAAIPRQEPRPSRSAAYRRSRPTRRGRDRSATS